MKIGFIGCGNIAGAMITGALKAGAVQPGEVIASAVDQEKLARFAGECGIWHTASNVEVASHAELLIPAVKPHQYRAVIEEIRGAVSPHTIVVSIAPGATLAELEEWFGRPVKLVRTMPNTPVTVGEGMTALCRNSEVTPPEMDRVTAFFQSFGMTLEVPESQIDAVVAVSGSSPAYVFMMLEAMADAAVLKGLPREHAYLCAAQAVLGAAKMVLQLGEHPAALKDKVCSPVGTTIEAVRVLEEKGFRSALIEAMVACAEKSKTLGRHSER